MSTQPATKPAHTPTPWKVDPSTAFNEACLSAGGVEIGHLYCSDGADEATELPGIANAELIVRAVNSHDALVDACYCVLELDQVSDILAGNETLRDLLEDVLAKAEGRSMEDNRI